MSIFPVIMCGGAGTRLWPASRPSRPKQFVSLDGGWSMFQRTVQRMAPLGGGVTPIVVCGARYEAIVRRQLAEAGLAATLLLEPEPRDSGPAMAAAAAMIAGLDPAGVAAIVASDHHIPDGEAFRTAVTIAARAAAEEWIVTLGVRPGSLSTAYGYIDPGGEIADGPVRRVRQFVEKPDAERAAIFLTNGFLWNSGNFVVAARTLLEELNRHAPELARAAQAAAEDSVQEDGVRRMGSRFLGAPKISIDYALMEKTDRAAVLPVDFVWSDLGAWDAIQAVGALDDRGNSVTGEALLVDSSGCVIRNEAGTRLAVVGLQRVAVIAESDAVLVCDLESSQAVKAVVDRLRAEGAPEIDLPPPTSLATWAKRYDTWLRTGALPVWWALGADHEGGGFHDALTALGRPHGGARQVQGQARQIQVFATAARMGWMGPWRQAAQHGLDFLLARCSRPDGLFGAAAMKDGAESRGAPSLDDQALALQALAAATRAWPDRSDLTARAEAVLTGLAMLRGPSRGFRESGPRPYQAKAHLHLLEAALSWFEIAGDGMWALLADELADLALDAFVDSNGRLVRGVFDELWRPVHGDEGRFVTPGDQFAWARVLMRWTDLRPGRDIGDLVGRLMQVGARGVEVRRGVVVDQLWDDLTVQSHRAPLWPQTERLRALLACMGKVDPATGRSLEQAATQASSALWSYLESPVSGLWRENQDPDGDPINEPVLASSLYDILEAVLALGAWMAVRPSEPDDSG